MVSFIKGGTQAKGIRRKNPETNIWMRMGSGEGFTMRNFTVCTVAPNTVRVIKTKN